MVTRRLKPFSLLSAAALLLLPPALFSAPPSLATDDILARSRAMYAELKSYADTGPVTYETGQASAPSRDRHVFTTYFSRAPRGFYFEFTKEGGDRFVIWGDPEAFHTWWKTTAVKSDYPNPSNTGAFYACAAGGSCDPPMVSAGTLDSGVGVVRTGPQFYIQGPTGAPGSFLIGKKQ